MFKFFASVVVSFLLIVGISGCAEIQARNQKMLENKQAKVDDAEKKASATRRGYTDCVMSAADNYRTSTDQPSDIAYVCQSKCEMYIDTYGYQMQSYWLLRGYYPEAKHMASLDVQDLYKSTKAEVITKIIDTRQNKGK